MSRHRLLCAMLLLAASLFHTTLAAPVSYEFSSYVGTRDTDGSPRLPGALTPNTEFVGTFTFDPARTEMDSSTQQTVIAPVVKFELRTANGVVLSSGPQPPFSRLETRSGPGGESVVIRMAMDLHDDRDTTVHAELSWAAPTQGQLPADPRTLDIATLQPYGWKLLLLGYEFFCYPGCDLVDDRIDAHVFTLSPQGTGGTYLEAFTAPPARWVNTAGAWTTQSGHYANTANTAFTSSVYTGQTLQPTFTIEADLFSGFNASGNALGLLFNYQNNSNFYELRFSATGTVTLNKVVNGVRTMLQTGRYSVPPRTWFHVSVVRAFTAFSSINVDDVPVMSTVVDDDLFDGRAGVFASWNLARFDNFSIEQRRNWSGETFVQFDNGPGPFEPVAGDWVASDGGYRNTSNQAAAISLAGTPDAADYTVDARIRLQWTASGNRGGLVYDYADAQNYRAALISARTANAPGTLEVIEIKNGVRQVVARSTDVTLAGGQWGEVSVSRIDNVTQVRATGIPRPGEPVGTPVSQLTLAQPAMGSQVGVIASWNLVRFDDFVLRSQEGPVR
jgi:hypothetical protein